MMLTEHRIAGRKPKRTAAENRGYTGDVPERTHSHDLNDAAGWLFIAIQNKIDEFIETPVYDLQTVRNCIDYLQSQILVLELIDNQIKEG